MRRLHDSNYPAIVDDSALAYWPCDIATTSSTIPDSSYSARFHLVMRGANPAGRVNSIFNDSYVSAASPGSGAVTFTSIHWADGTASSAFARTTMASEWSIGMWTAVPSAATRCLFEFSNRETIANNAEECLIGVYVNADFTLAYGWDRGTGCFHYKNTGVTVDSTSLGFHLGLIRQKTPSSDLFKTTLVLNGAVRHIDETGPFSLSGASSIFVLGGSKRFGTGTGASLAFVNIPRRFDDVVVFNRAVAPEKMRELFRNGVRPWNERRLLDSKNAVGNARVLVEDGDGNMVNLSAYYGTDFVRSVRVTDNVDAQNKSATVTLLRYRGERLNLAPLDQLAVNNLDASGAFDSLLEHRRKIQIEVAVYPHDFSPEEWMYERLFDGYIDELSWGADSVVIDAIDKIAPLNDTFQLDPRFYSYGESSTTLAETHLQTLINNNVPRVFAAGATLTFGYRGGTPALYTPASSGWVLRYDDSPSGEVSKLLQAVADQIGWRCRYSWYEPWQEDRLTFERPNRSLTYDARAFRDADGKVVVDTNIPHDLSVDQLLTLTGTSSLNFTSKPVIRVMNARRVKVDYDPGTAPSTESGTLAYDVHCTLSDSHVQRFDDVKKDGQSIRNAVFVKFKRTNSAITLPYTSISNSAGGVLEVTFSTSSPGIRDSLRSLTSGEQQSFTISGSSVGVYNRSWTFGALSAGNIVQSVETLSAATTDTNGVFKSSYINFQQVIGVNTPSISKYGYRPVGIYEESNGNIDTEQEAKALADAVLSDLAEPTAAVRVTIPFSPWFDLDDYVALSPDLKRRWSSTLNASVTEIEHNLSGGVCYTSLALRNATPSNGTAWVGRIAINDRRPSLPDGFEMPVVADYLDNIQNNLGARLGGRVRPHFLRSGQRRQMRRMWTELHIGSTPTFVPDDSTLAAIGPAGGELMTHYDPNANPILPGSVYFVRYRDRDVLGNPAKFEVGSLATSLVARFQEKPPGCRVSQRITSSSMTFSASPNWSVFPFFDATASPNYSYPPGAFTVLNMNAGTTPFVSNAGSASGSYFRMPCDGIAVVQGRAGVRNSGSVKATAVVQFGLFRVGSTLPGGNASTPVIPMYSSEYVETASPTSTITSIMVASTNIGTYVTFDGQVSAHSGDYILLGVRPETIGFYVPAAAANSSASLSWLHISVAQT
jgi:hypothetical protein